MDPPEVGSVAEDGEGDPVMAGRQRTAPTFEEAVRKVIKFQTLLYGPSASESMDEVFRVVDEGLETAHLGRRAAWVRLRVSAVRARADQSVAGESTQREEPVSMAAEPQEPALAPEYAESLLEAVTDQIAWQKAWKPCGTAPIPRSRTIFPIASLESIPPRAEGNTTPALSVSARASCSTTSAPLDSGTRCARFVFIRSAGMRHSRTSRSISSHCAPRTSPLRHAVSTRNSNASTVPG